MVSWLNVWSLEKKTDIGILLLTMDMLGISHELSHSILVWSVTSCVSF